MKALLSSYIYHPIPLRSEVSRTDPQGLCAGSGSCSSDGSQGGNSEGGGWIALVGGLDGYFMGFGPNGAPFSQGLAFEVDGFSASNEEALGIVASGVGQPQSQITVPENVILDQDANNGKGLTCEQYCKFKDMQKGMADAYQKIGILFKVSYTDGYILYASNGKIVDIVGLKKGSLNVFVFGGSLPVVLNGASGEGTGGSTVSRVQNVRYALTFIGLKDATAFTLEHEFAHHFIGNTLGATGFLKNVFMDEYINHVVLPHLERYGETMRDFAQQILNP